MVEYKDKIFHSLFDRGESVNISSVACHNCRFINCWLSLTTDIRQRSIVKDASLTNCTIESGDIGPALLQNIRIDGLVTGPLLIVWGAVFDRVQFSGEIGKIKINRVVHQVDRSESTQGPFDDFRTKFYEKAEWALDISQAKFRCFEIAGIPARLIRRDPATQVIVTRERALDPEWRSKISSDADHWRFVIDMFIADGEEDQVLVAPSTGPAKQRDKLLRGLDELRRLGVVE